ncbi:lipopolysaccharide biosynthesis protein [Microlunatus ginsengisoli]|uniref:Lipopolysaccharide biosynthesis protein n=1 Tax=Microlunatus ginsengisoli TaxID=363863 RepID=A0ABP6ZH18_9ACTN
MATTRGSATTAPVGTGEAPLSAHAERRRRAAAARERDIAAIQQPRGVQQGQGGTSVRWSMAAVLGRQISQMVCALVLARLLGPETYGVISAATVYVTFTTLLLDQGLAAALVQRPVLSRFAPGAVATANLLCGLALALITIGAAPAVADFFRAPDLTPLLQVLGVGLLIKALAITPRAINLRLMRFRLIGVADISGGVLGAIAGISAALAGAGIWSMAVQVIFTDLVIAVVLLARTHGTRPNHHLGELTEILPFSLRLFGSNALAFASRNLDNILVGRFLGVTALSLYSMAYRVLVIPVQMIGQTVNRVTFPMFSRLAGDQPRLGRNLIKVTELLAFATIPGMFAIAVASPQLIDIVLGHEWAATAPVLSILAVAGARETVFSVTQSLMRAKGVGKLVLRYEFLATGVQLTGIVIGLQFGLIGVALGFTIAGFLLSPVMLVIQRRLSSAPIRTLLGRMLRPTHASLWGVAGYLGIRLIGWNELVTLLVGGVVYVVLLGAVLLLVHRAALRRAIAAAVEIFVPGRSRTGAVPRRAAE